MFFSALEIVKYIATMDETEDIGEYLAIFSLGDELNKEICKFLSENCSVCENTTSQKEVLSDTSEEHSSATDICFSDVSEEYFDSDDENA